MLWIFLGITIFRHTIIERMIVWFFYFIGIPTERRCPEKFTVMKKFTERRI